MASQEQKRLADIVKNVHSKLRKSVRLANGDYTSVWRDHCSDRESLENYASAMYSLAVNHWSQDSPLSRVRWCYDVTLEYFREEGLRKMIEKQKKRLQYAGQDSQCCCCFENSDDPTCLTVVFPSKNDKLNVLDVGSCFNPFVEFEEFETVAIDLQPASSTVYKCDFLNLEVFTKWQGLKKNTASDETEKANRKKSSSDLREVKDGLKSITSTVPTVSGSHSGRTGEILSSCKIEPFLQSRHITCLPEESFHVVIFSLLLSYFPSSNQRWDCCVKAHRLLAANGLLLIVTPDSSHQNRNCQMIKSWKHAMETMGFVRWRYVKQTHLHCMAFRKVSKCHNHFLETGATPDMMFIPQDFHEDDSGDVHIPRTEEDNQTICDLFDALPGDDIL